MIISFLDPIRLLNILRRIPPLPISTGLSQIHCILDKTPLAKKLSTNSTAKYHHNNGSWSANQRIIERRGIRRLRTNSSGKRCYKGTELRCWNAPYSVHNNSSFQWSCFLRQLYYIIFSPHFFLALEVSGVFLSELVLLMWMGKFNCNVLINTGSIISA